MLQQDKEIATSGEGSFTSFGHSSKDRIQRYMRDELESHLVVMWLGEVLAGVTRRQEARDMACRLGSPLAWRKRTGTF
jgi:hypothetical protein